MSESVLISLIAIGSSAISVLLTWLVGRKKQNSEIKSTEIEDLKQSLEFLKESNLKNTESLDKYMRIVDTERLKVYKLSTIVLKILDNSCTKKACFERVFYSEEEVAEILGSIQSAKDNNK